MRRKIDALEHKIRTGDEQGPGIGQSPGSNLYARCLGMGNGDGVGDVQRPPAAKIEQPKRRVAVLLNFREDQSRTDRLDGARGDKYAIARPDLTPSHRVGNRAVLDR